MIIKVDEQLLLNMHKTLFFIKVFGPGFRMNVLTSILSVGVGYI